MDSERGPGARIVVAGVIRGSTIRDPVELQPGLIRVNRAQPRNGRGRRRYREMGRVRQARRCMSRPTLY